MLSRMFQDNQFGLQKMHPPLTLHRHPMCAEVCASSFLLTSDALSYIINMLMFYLDTMVSLSFHLISLFS